MMKRWCSRVLAIGAVFLVASCAGNPPATTPGGTSAAVAAEYPLPEIPAALTVTPEIRDQHLAAWKRLQAGDSRGASRGFTNILKANPQFYPSETGLGFVQLSSRQFKNANQRFTAAIAVNDRYLPAWIGQAEAWLGLNRDVDAIAAMERILVLDPKRETVRTRLELVRFRLTQSHIEAGRKARTANRLDDAEKQFEAALALSPTSTMILHELSAVELAAKHYDEAELHARKAADVEPREAQWQVELGTVLEARGNYRDAAAAFTRAATLEPTNPEWRTRSADLREKAALADLPATFAALPTAATITRADVAAFIGIRLDDLIAAAPRRVTDVVTDVRSHWAESWIVPVTQAGVMNIFPNHTFQPAATMRRADLASVVAALVRLVGASHRTDLARWQAARPRFADLPGTHVSYPSVALAVAAGAMTADATGRFQPTEPATGADLDAAVKRISALSVP